jgi:DNA ligase-1
MRDFLALLTALEAARGAGERIAALSDGLRRAEAAEAAWIVALLLGIRPARILNSQRLRALLARASGLPEWLIEACHAHAGDLAETAALLLPGGGPGLPPLARLVEEELLPLAARPLAEREQAVLSLWARARPDERFALNKLLTGGWRLGVARGTVIRALARLSGQDPWRIAERLAGDWQPSAGHYQALVTGQGEGSDPARPYPFFLASPLGGPPMALGAPEAWLAEWKWDGIRAQLIRRGPTTAIWSRGGERIEARFPELAAALARLPADAVLDGEVLIWRESRPEPFSALQRRLQRRHPSRRLLAELPARFLAFDLLECRGEDLRPLPLAERHRRLRELIEKSPHEISISDCLDFTDWEELAVLRERCRAFGVEGLMLKRRDSPYRVGRVRGDWWKWKLEPYTVDAVLVYAEPGHGRRAGLLTDYTFAVRGGEGQWVPIAKAYSGLTEEEIIELDRWLRRHTRQRFGPVRQVEPRWVFELAFEGIAPSTRHRAGLALRFPRILRWRRDLDPSAADTLDALRALLAG